MAASVSIIICTRNQADSLAQTLLSLGRCVVPADLAAELVVVDNGSTDATPRVIAEHRAAPGLPVRRVFEPAVGLSNARNAGLRHTTSTVILFTDDDVRPPANWIEAMCRPILSGQADAVAGGVHFPPEYERALSEEPFRSRRGWLASTEHLDPLCPQVLVGANMAFSRRVAEVLGGFDPELGAGALGFGEESLFAGRLLDAGFRLHGELGISVAHHFDRSRLTVPALMNMAERMGRSTAYLDYHRHHAEAKSARTEARRAWALLAWEWASRPWRKDPGDHRLRMTQRAMTLAYWKQLAAISDEPRRYPRSAADP